MESPGSIVADALAESARLEAAGRLVDAVDLLDAVDREVWDPTLERRLVELRHGAVAEASASASPSPWPDVAPFAGPFRDEMPVIPRASLTAEMVRSAIVSRGCALVPGAVPAERCREMIEKIDRGFAASDAHSDSVDAESRAWYQPFNPPADAVPGSPGIDPVRLGRESTLWAVDSPRLFEEVCVLIEEIGMRRIVTDYLGERPFISAKKSNLRRVTLDNLYASWHQDGAFMGEGIRTLNVWIALNDCGVDSPGMDIIPRRFDTIVETGADGAMFDWAVSPATVAEVAPDAVVRPRFSAGDILLFDELFLHRTACEVGMTRERYAIENWFFAPSSGYGNQVPLLY